ncbi:erythromycin resistance leader peptide [Oceanobacillus jeddahense]
MLHSIRLRFPTLNQ